MDKLEKLVKKVAKALVVSNSVNNYYDSNPLGFRWDLDVHIAFAGNEYMLCYQWQGNTNSVGGGLGALTGYWSELGISPEAYSNDGYDDLAEAIFEKYPELDENYDAVDEAIGLATKSVVNKFYRFSIRETEKEAKKEAKESKRIYCGDGVFISRQDDD